MTFPEAWIRGMYPLRRRSHLVPSKRFPRRPVMPPSIRAATPQDVPAIVALLTLDAQERRSLDPLLWRLATDAPIRIERAVGATFNGSRVSAPELWFVAEHAGRVFGVARAMIVPVPPIYDGAAGSPGLLLDDCFISAEAPSGTAEALLVTTEAALRAAGARRIVASCPQRDPCGRSTNATAIGRLPSTWPSID